MDWEFTPEARGQQVMNIAIIGAGNVGQALGRGWTKAGHQIGYGVRDPKDEKARTLAGQQPAATVTSNQDVVRQADVVVLSTPWGTTEAAIRTCGSLAGKIVIDCTNPLKADFSGLDRGFDTSGAEQVAQWAPGAHVLKSMNQVGFALKDRPGFPSGLKPVMFVAGDGDKKKTVLRLVEDLGFEAIDAGGLRYARLLEPYAMLWIHLALSQGLGREFAFALLRK
jgi:predicted dinucleotide-binding enzyme